MVAAYMSFLEYCEKKKKVGTIEQINVTPIKKYQVVLRKNSFLLDPLGLSFPHRIVFCFADLVWNSASEAYSYCMAFWRYTSLALLGLGLLISTTAIQQQAAMSVLPFSS